MLSDDRILGSGEFVETVLGEAEERIRHQLPMDQRLGQARGWIQAACDENGVSVEELWSGSRRGPLSRLRKEIALRLVTELGLPQAQTARLLGVTTAAVAKSLMRAQAGQV